MDISREIRDPYRVALLLIDGFALLSYACIVEPMRAANLLGGAELFAVRHFSVRGGHAKSSAGALVPAIGIAEAGYGYDLVLVVAGGEPALFDDESVFAWLRGAARKQVPVGGVSGGPVILARAGLMDGRRMAVHWEHAPALAEMSPYLHLERALYVIDRDRITCAGGTAPMDLMHALIAGRQGQQFARLVSDWFLHTEIRQSHGSQRAGLVERYGTTNRAVLYALELMESHIADPLSLGQLAALSKVGPRQLNRLFRAELGQSTIAFYKRLRLKTAHSMLKGSPLSITEIALAVGFADSAHFSREFSKNYGMPPNTIRKSPSVAA